MQDTLSREQQLRRRAVKVRAALEELWGDELPDAPDPVLTVLMDAVAVDDEAGTEQRLVVQGDGLGYDALARVLADVRSAATLHLVPSALRARLTTSRSAAAAGVLDRRVAGESALPSEASGAWEYDAREDTIAWDARSALLCGLGRPGVAPLAQCLRRCVHPDDQTRIAGALRASAATGLPYDVRFRTVSPHAGPVAGSVIARGRVLGTLDGGVRILGFAAQDLDAG